MRAQRAATVGSTSRSTRARCRWKAEPRKEETSRALLEGADLRTGAAVPTAALPVGAGTRAPVEHPATDADPGEDLVPEPPLQVEEGAPGEGLGHGAAAFTATDRRSRAGP